MNMKQVALVLYILTLSGAFANPIAADSLYNNFVQPPRSASPQAWWHWMNGSIDADEARKDLEWLNEVGIGGVQLFEAGLGPEAPAGERVIYQSGEWRAALEASAGAAKSLGLDFAITTAPGWSATGGPWVEPKDAMKKLVWSVTTIVGGQEVHSRLIEPPKVSGPFQDIPASAQGGPNDLPDYYQDIVTLAVPVKEASPLSFDIQSGDSLPAGEFLTDGQFWPAAELAAGATGEASLLLVAKEPVTVQAITVGLPGRQGFGAPQPPYAELQYSQDGVNFHKIVELPATKSLVRTASFAPVDAMYFRLLLAQGKGPGFADSLNYAPGVRKLPFPETLENFSISEIELHGEPRVHAVEEKAGFAPADDYYAIPTPGQLRPAAGPDDIIDVTAYVTEDGVLNWDAPAGTWQVLRFGFSLTGHQNGPAPREATGLEVDKLSAERVEQYLDRYLSIYSNEDGELLDGITGLLSDSIESGAQNWTEKLPEYFETQHGYDPLPWLPTVAGLIIDSPEASDRFLWDLRETIATLYVKNYYETIARAARSRGVSYYAEALEDHRPQLGNDLNMRTPADIPMAAFWYFEPSKGPKPTFVADIQGAASVAHVYDKPIVAVEAITTGGQPWAVGPKELKIAADWAFVTGANQLMLHSSVHQAVGKNYTPGQSMMPLLGHYFNRNTTWANLAKPWITYLTRTQFLLQQGHFVADFAYFIGEEAPVTGLFGDEPPQGIPTGFQYDFVSADGLALLGVRDGKLVTASGIEYRFIYLGGASEQMTIATLECLRDLAEAGATIVGRKPEGSPSLTDDDAVFEALAAATWSLPTVIDLESPAAAVETLGMEPEWRFTAADKVGTDAVHILKRSLPDADVYFVVNSLGTPVRGTLSVAAQDQQPELWLAANGTRHVPDDWQLTDGVLDVTLELAPHEAQFLVLRPQGQISSESLADKTVAPPEATALDFDGPWAIKFDPKYGDAPSLSVDEPAPLNEHADASVRYYSGLVTYSNIVTMRAEDLNASSRIVLETSNIGDIAVVRVNESEAGYLWAPPYELDLKPYLQPGPNRVEVQVANYWANRMIGFSREGLSVPGFPEGVYESDAPLRVAGLVGPLRLARVQSAVP